ncbi:hypothetical protein MHYP_G00118770 [Metynnis hypsauchen]
MLLNKKRSSVSHADFGSAVCVYRRVAVEISDLSVVLVLPCSPTQKVATKRCNPMANVSRQKEKDEAVLERVAAGQQSRAAQSSEARRGKAASFTPNSPVSVREGSSGFCRPRNEEQKRPLSRRTPLSSRRTQHGSH